MTLIAAHIEYIKKSITECEKKFHRPQGSVQLLAASKNRSAEQILEAVRAGQFVFGENYVQEALPKMEHVNHALGMGQIEWHFIGPIQRNKTRKIAEHFDWVQSVDDMKVAERLNDQRPDNLPLLNICIEININAEATKSGIAPADVLDLAKYCAALPKLKLRGLMAIPQIAPNFEVQREEFHTLKLLWDELQKQGFNLDTLSMGMTEDYAAAIAEGSTMVRIGTGIFGPRP